MLISDDDVIAIHRENLTGGKAAAMKWWKKAGKNDLPISTSCNTRKLVEFLGSWERSRKSLKNKPDHIIDMDKKGQ